MVQGIDTQTGQPVEITGVHPVADLFPMLPDDELRELGESIRVEGQLQPGTIDAQGRLLDGRNRAAACELIGVGFYVSRYAGEDPDGYALTVNITRRHLTTGARAMIAAKAAMIGSYKFVTAANEAELPNTRISEARLVLDWCDATVEHQVIAGQMPLSTAVEEARKLKRQDEDRQKKEDWLNAHAPDLLTLVREERMSLADAVAVLEARQREEEERRQAEINRQNAEEAERQRRRQDATKKVFEAVNAITQLRDVCDITDFDPELAHSVHVRGVTRQMISIARGNLDEVEKIITTKKEE